MAKKGSVKDLDAELAALEAELAALEAKKKGGGPRVAGGGTTTPKPAPAAPSLQPAAQSPPPTAVPGLWRRDGDAWVRTVPGEGRVVRRVLDEQGNVVREETATRRDLDDISEVKAERGVGKLLGRFKK